MVKKTISELDDILLTQESSAVVAIEQNGATFKAPVRPNPTNQINVSSQAQLEASILGNDLIVPDGETIAVVIDAPFTLNKPFQIGLESVLDIYGAVSQTELTWAGAGALFRNENPANLIDSLLLHDLFIIGNEANALFDIRSSKFCFVTNTQMTKLADLGDIKAAIINLVKFSVSETRQGLRIDDFALCKIFSSGIFNDDIAATGITFVSIRSSTPASVIMDEVSSLFLHTTDSVFFIDPNSTFAFSVIEKSPLPFFGGDFYQPDNPFPVSSVINAGGQARFNTGVAHGLVVGRPVILSGFSEGSYNGTFFVTNIATAVEFDVGISFVAGDSGNLNTGSLDSTSVNVRADKNSNIPDSMFTGDAGLEIFGSEITSSSLGTDVSEVITSALWGFSGLERFSIGVSNEGQLIANDVSLRKYTVTFSGTIEKSGGGSTDVGIVVLKNGAIASFNPPHTVNSGKIQISGSDIIELIAGDTVQIAVINYDSTAAVIIISQISLVVNLA